MHKPVSSVSRRDFVTKIGGGAAVTAAAALAPVETVAAVSGAHYVMVIDLRRCTGCHACSIACKSEFDVILGGTRSWVEFIEKGTYPKVTRSFLPRLCNNCSEPPCVLDCPTDATWKRPEDGIVVIDQDECIGCKRCVKACPYDARYMDNTTGIGPTDKGVADKCDFCFHRVVEGVVPACVNTCTGKARIFGDLNDPYSEVSRLIANNRVTVLKPEEGTKPNVYYIDADHTEESDARFTGHYVRVTTHRHEEVFSGHSTIRRAGEGRR